MMDHPHLSIRPVAISLTLSCFKLQDRVRLTLVALRLVRGDMCRGQRMGCTCRAVKREGPVAIAVGRSMARVARRVSLARAPATSSTTERAFGSQREAADRRLWCSLTRSQKWRPRRSRQSRPSANLCRVQVQEEGEEGRRSKKRWDFAR